MIQVMETWRPSIVVRESQEYATVVAAEKAGIPHVRIAITARSAELSMLEYAAPSVDAHRSGVGLPKDPSAKRILDERAMTLYPASLEAPGTDSALVSRYRAASAEPRPLPDWWPGREGPFVYVTLGTAIGNMDTSRALYRVVLDALVDQPIRVLLTIGKDLPLELLGDVPPNVHVERFVPQEEVLPHAAAILHHGGSGTTIGSLAAGVPMVVTPMFADQPFNAERVATTGAGIALPTRGATPDDIRRALGRVLEEPSFREIARRCAQQIAGLSPVDDAGIELERLARRG
jgi:UDP:flavonoid glycosyltransferase YjiC (YdhE family)